jgi:AAA family ATP:ADP antiporter
MEKSLSFINRAFNLRPGDFSRALPLFAYYLLIITFYAMGRVARVAIFLEHFKAVQLPYADMSVAVAASLVVAPYIRAGRRVSLPNLQTGCLLFFFVSLVGFWWGIHVRNLAWLSPVFYVWVGICGVLTIAQVWTLANFVWNTREAKRRFGMLASGGIVGGILGGFLTNWTARHLGADAMLLCMAGLLPICVVLIRITWKQKRQEPEDAAPANDSETPKSLMDSFRLVKLSAHLKTIAALICLCSAVTTLSSWQLNAIAKETYPQKDALAAFLGTFTFCAGIASLVAQLFLTTKLLRRWGVGVALLILPLSLSAGSLAVLLWGSLWAASILKGSDGVFRYSIDTSAVQLLYLPISAKIKVQVKSFIDTVVWKIGDGLAGLTLLVLATNLHFTPRQISWVTLLLLATWIGVTFIARNQYVATLRENIQQVRIRPEEESVPVVDQFTTNVFAEKLNSHDPSEVLYALSLFEMGQQARAHSAVRNLLEHPSPYVRTKAVSILNNANDVSVRQQVRGMMHDNNLAVRAEALRYLSRHDEVDPLTYVDSPRDYADFSIRSATFLFLNRPGEGQNTHAARIILDGIVADLGDSQSADDAARTLKQLGEEAVPALHDRLSAGDELLEVRMRIPGILLDIGTVAAAEALAGNLIQAEPGLRIKVISALNKLCEDRGNLELDKKLIESAMIAEMMGHYRSYQILASENGGMDDKLKQSMNDELERIFRLMKLLFPSLDLQTAYHGIQSSDPTTHANALEFLDNTLNPQLRSRLVPLIDSEVSFQERVRLADRFLGLSAS